MFIMGHVVRFNGKKLDPATIKALVAGTLVSGTKPSVWWNRQSIDFRNSFMDTIRTSMRNGESLTQAITRVVGGTVDGVSYPGIMKTTKAKAGALAATAQSAVTNEAALKTFQANNDVIKAVSQISTLDNRTSDICVAYSGQTWDVNTLQPVMGGTLPFNGGPPRHFNCRSRLRPVTMSFKELGIDQAEIPAGTRASMDGQVPSDITFNQFLKKKSNSFQDDLLGRKRAQLWRDDQITLTQLVDMRGNPLSITQLEQKLGIPPKVDPLKVVKKTPTEPKLVESFLDDVLITEAEHAEITAHSKRLVAAAEDADAIVTKQVKNLADDVGAKFPDAPIGPGGSGPIVDEGSLHWRLKEVDSTQVKIQKYARDRNLTFTEAADQISDSLRYTYIVDEDDYIKAVQEVMERFAELGYKNNKFDPAWLLRPDYKGLNINLVSPQGVRMEMQFHTARSFEVKNGINHDLYKKFELLTKSKQAGKEGQALQAEMLANSQAVPVPKNIQFLEDLAKIYNKPSVAQQNKIFAQAKRRQLAAEKKADRVKAAAQKKRDAKAARELKAREKKALADQKLIEKEIEAAKKKEAMTEADAVESALKGEFQKLGETQAVIDANVEGYANAPNYMKSAIGQRQSLNKMVTEYDARRSGGASYKHAQNEIWIHGKSHPNAIGRNATWRHEFGHAVDFDLADRYYRLAGTVPQTDKWGKPIISRAFNKALLADNRQFQKWQVKNFKDRFRDDGKPKMQTVYDRLTTKHATKSFEVGREKYYEPLLRKHGMTYKQIKEMAKRNFDLQPARKLDNYVDDILLPNMLASIETGNVGGFISQDVATQFIFKGGGDMASLSDYIGSITKNKVRGWWGHSDSYYGRIHGVSGKHKEAFANFFGMIGGPDGAFFESLLRAWKTDKYLDDLIDAMKLLEKG